MIFARGPSLGGLRSMDRGAVPELPERRTLEPCTGSVPLRAWIRQGWSVGTISSQLGDSIAMKRRRFLAVSSLALAMPGGAALAGQGQVEYDRAAFDRLLASGKPVLLDFYTTW